MNVDRVSINLTVNPMEHHRVDHAVCQRQPGYGERARDAAGAAGNGADHRFLNPGNNVSSAVTFTVNPSVPAVISSLSKTSATAGDAAFPLTVNGTGFISSAVVNFGANALATSFVSATQLTAAVPVSLLLTPGTFPVVVQQAGTSSNAISFVVNLPASPSLRLNPPTAIGPDQQPIIDFGLNAPYPIPLSATVTLSFVSNATVPIVDPAIQFLGERNLDDVFDSQPIPPRCRSCRSLPVPVAGTPSPRSAVRLTAAGVNVTPSSGSTCDHRDRQTCTSDLGREG